MSIIIFHDAVLELISIIILFSSRLFISLWGIYILFFFNTYLFPLVAVESDAEIKQEDTWSIISAYFEEKGLVRQQLDSFDEFIQNTMQEIVDESADIVISPEAAHAPGQAPVEQVEHHLFILSQNMQLHIHTQTNINIIAHQAHHSRIARASRASHAHAIHAQHKHTRACTSHAHHMRSHAPHTARTSTNAARAQSYAA